MLNGQIEICSDKPIEIAADYTANPDNTPEWHVNSKIYK